MAISSGYRCFICGKKRVFGRSISHSGVHTPRVFRPNLQIRHIIVDGQLVHIKLCTKCIKRLKREVINTPKVLKASEPQTPATV